MRVRPVAGSALLLAALVAVGLAASHATVTRAGRNRVHTVEDCPPRPVGIVFGAGLGSTILRRRVEAGAALYRAGKVARLLLSGDNRTRSHDEPTAMRRLALADGVPARALVLDYAGRRTYDTCARAREIFGVQGAVLVTQRFHLDRALYLCDQLGLDVVGVAADDPVEERPSYALRLHLREVLADAVAWFDVHVRRPSYIGGPALPIRIEPDAGPPAEALDATPDAAIGATPAARSIAPARTATSAP